MTSPSSLKQAGYKTQSRRDKTRLEAEALGLSAASTPGNDRYLREADGWSRRFADPAGGDRERRS
jgi:hypothetical protein